MKLILNIGLDVGATRTMHVSVVHEILSANGFLRHRERVIESDTEPTLVVEVSHLGSPMSAALAVFILPRDLQQDCIAVYNPATKVGALAGPRANEWGPFDPARFFLLDGKRLSETNSQPTE